MVFYEDDFIPFQHRHQDAFQFAFPEFTFIKPGLHRLPRSEIGKAMKKSVSGSSTERKGPGIFIPIFVGAGIDLDRNISRNSERLPGFVFIRAHFDNHVLPPEGIFFATEFSIVGVKLGLRSDGLNILNILALLVQWF